ncbi:hypothetical protein [Planosporangium sp. 12N6]|uniref:hypothetical protein n=1 Tax=Planosporangium spinosum TaxID=3402278 RepID=UPI003CEE9827
MHEFDNGVAHWRNRTRWPSDFHDTFYKRQAAGGRRPTLIIELDAEARVRQVAWAWIVLRATWGLERGSLT